MTASEPTVADPRTPARFWIALASIALVFVLLAPIAPPVLMTLFPFHVSDPPGTQPPFGGLNDIIAHVSVAALIFACALGAGNLAGLAAVPFAITALTRCGGAVRLWFISLSTIFFVVGPLLEIMSAVTLFALLWNLPFAAMGDPSTGTLSPHWEWIMHMLVFGILIVPIAIDLARFAVMVLAGFVAYCSGPRPAPQVSRESRQPLDLPAPFPGAVEFRTSPFT